MMNYRHTLTAKTAKFIGSILDHRKNLHSRFFRMGEVIPMIGETESTKKMKGFQISKTIRGIMTIAFSLVAFAHGQSCTLLPGRNPSTLADGQSRTGYQVAEATYTQSCTSSAGLITCISGSVANGNTFKYPSCIPHTWANCTTPTGANNLEFRMLYKSAQATYTQTCQQISQNLQCLNGVFTGGVTPWLYTFASCTDPNRAQCVDLRTNSYKDHGETVIGYTAKNPSNGQMCSTLQRTLTCTNGTWSGGNQTSLFTGCKDPSSFPGCVNTRVSPAITVPHGSSLNAYTSPEYFGTGTCDNILKPLTCINGVWSGGNQASLYSGCVQGNTKPCFNIIAGTGTLLHGSFITKYTKQFAFEALKESCSQFDVSQQCNNGVRSGGSAQYTGCQNVASGSCKDSSTNIYTPNFQSIIKYTIGSATSTISCEQSKKSFTCVNGVRSGDNPSSYPYPTCGGCKLPRGTTVSEGWYGSGYSVTSAIFPKTCEKNYSTALSCSGGILNGNRQTYKYAKCENPPVIEGIDLSINDSQGFPGTPNDIGYLVAQGSSPQISILFKNNGNQIFNKSISSAGFLTCIRKEQNLKIYESKPITSFVVNPGTKVGINIRLSSLFTQALGTKVVKCDISSRIGGYTDAVPANDGWTSTVEVVKADRFDLALSTSIEPISKNLEAAEGAKGTQGVQNFLFNKIMNVLVPLVVILGILSAILGFYKIMFSTEDTATKEGVRYIIFGVIGIILIMSSKFIGQNVFNLLSPDSGQIKGFEVASGLYNQILYPFIKFAIYLVLGAMFVILVTRVITFLFGTDADAQKKAGTLIGWNVISMLIIIGAKQIVEAIYGKQESVVKDITNLGEVGSGVLADKNIPILYQVINYALGIASLVILVIIIIQTVKLLMKPDDPAQLKNIKNSLLYMLIGILVLGAGYLIVNFAIIN